MMLRRCVAIFLVSLVAPVESDAQAQVSTRAATPGIHEMVLPGAGRRYTLAIPDGYTGQEPVPLIVSLHYGGTVTPFYGRGLVEALVAPALGGLGAIIVAPDSAAGNWANPASEQHVMELLDYIEANYNIDSEKTLITGYSMGGGGTWYLAPRHPERFKAAIVMAGRPQADTTSLDWETPMYVIHSTADQVVPFAATEVAVERLRDQGVPIELVVLDGISHYEIPRFRPALLAAVSWIQQAWAR